MQQELANGQKVMLLTMCSPRFYWSSTTWEANGNTSLGVNLSNGLQSSYLKASTFYVWPVRGGN